MYSDFEVLFHVGLAVCMLYERHSFADKSGTACNRNFDKAMQSVSALRGASVRLRRGAGFNQFLEEVAKRFGPGSMHWDFWQRLEAERVSLITNEEEPGVGVDAAAAAAFLQQHSATDQKVCCALVPYSAIQRIHCDEAGVLMLWDCLQ